MDGEAKVCHLFTEQSIAHRTQEYDLESVVYYTILYYVSLLVVSGLVSYLGRHHIVCASVCFASNYCDLRYGGFRISEQ